MTHIKSRNSNTFEAPVDSFPSKGHQDNHAIQHIALALIIIVAVGLIVSGVLALYKIPFFSQIPPFIAKILAYGGGGLLFITLLAKGIQIYCTQQSSMLANSTPSTKPITPNTTPSNPLVEEEIVISQQPPPTWNSLSPQEQKIARTLVAGGLKARTKKSQRDDREIPDVRVQRELLLLFPDIPSEAKSILKQLQQDALQPITPEQTENYRKQLSSVATNSEDFFKIANLIILQDIPRDNIPALIELSHLIVRNLPKELIPKLLKECQQKYPPIIEQAFFVLGIPEGIAATLSGEEEHWKQAKQNIEKDLKQLRDGDLTALNPELSDYIQRGILTPLTAQKKLEEIIAHIDRWLAALARKEPSRAPAWFHATTQSPIAQLACGELSIAYDFAGGMGSSSHPGVFVSNRPEFYYGDVAFAFTQDLQWHAPFMTAECSDTASWFGFNTSIPVNQRAHIHKQALIQKMLLKMQQHHRFLTLPPWKQKILLRQFQKVLAGYIRCTVESTGSGSKLKYFLLSPLSIGDKPQQGKPLSQDNFSNFILAWLEALNDQAQDPHVKLLTDDLALNSLTLDFPVLKEPSSLFMPNLCGIAVFDEEIVDKDFLTSNKVVLSTYKPITPSRLRQEYPYLADLPCYTFLQIHLLRRYKVVSPFIPANWAGSDRRKYSSARS
jgi:hypothetical protein